MTFLYKISPNLPVFDPPAVEPEPPPAAGGCAHNDPPPPDSNPCPTQQIDVIFKPSEISQTFKGLQQVDGNSLDDDFSA